MCSVLVLHEQTHIATRRLVCTALIFSITARLVQHLHFLVHSIIPSLVCMGTTPRVSLATVLIWLAILLADRNRQDHKFVNTKLVRYTDSTRVVVSTDIGCCSWPFLWFWSIEKWWGDCPTCSNGSYVVYCFPFPQMYLVGTLLLYSMQWELLSMLQRHSVSLSIKLTTNH